MQSNRYDSDHRRCFVHDLDDSCKSFIYAKRETDGSRCRACCCVGSCRSCGSRGCSSSGCCDIPPLRAAVTARWSHVLYNCCQDVVAVAIAVAIAVAAVVAVVTAVAVMTVETNKYVGCDEKTLQEKLTMVRHKSISIASNQ